LFLKILPTLQNAVKLPDGRDHPFPRLDDAGIDIEDDGAQAGWSRPAE
jgi:hypothetical protein